MKHLQVCAAILTNDHHILCLQRGPGAYEYTSYKYEFPGGKLEGGESAAEALHRELTEEMNLDIAVEDMEFFMTVHHVYPDFEITMHSFLCPVATRAFDMLEHVDFRWLTQAELDQLDWAAADEPIMRALMEREEIE